MKNKKLISSRIITQFLRVSLMIIFLAALVTPTFAAPIVQEPQPSPNVDEIIVQPTEETAIPTEIPTIEKEPVDNPTLLPGETPTNIPTPLPSETPTNIPTSSPSEIPPNSPTPFPTETTTLVPTPTQDGAPLSALLIPEGADIIPNQYIVVLKSGNNSLSGAASVSASALGAVNASGGKVTHVYTAALQGYAAYLPPDTLNKVRSDPMVAYVEAVQRFSIGKDNYREVATNQTSAPWGLDRIDQHTLPLNSVYSYDYTASNVDVYVIDTGVRSTHTEFGGRATKDYDSIGDSQDGNDCNGHGTHVAGTIGSATYGVAKGVRIHAVRVLDCNGEGDTSTVVAGVDWVTLNHTDPAVANMSLGGGASTALDAAIQASINAGVTYVVAAGNSGNTWYPNACSYSPARLPAAITVGSTTRTDTRSSFSNYGTCLDIFAPGESISSLWNTSDTATNTISGTSMASPHVAGVAALYLSINAAASPATVASALIRNSTLSKVKYPGSGSPNRLLYALILPPLVPTPRTPSGTVYTGNPTFTWTKVTGATKYALYVYTNTTPSVAKLATSTFRPICGTSTCSYTPRLNLKAGSYLWSVIAGNNFGFSTFSPWIEFSPSTPAVPIQQAPSITVYTGNPTFSWIKTAWATKYALYVYTDASPSVKKLVKNSFSPSCRTGICTYTPRLNLTAGSYKWAVRASNTLGWSDYSTWLVFSIPPPLAPTPITPSVTVNSAKPTFTWTKPAGVTKYALYVYTDASPSVMKLAISSFKPTCGTSTCSYTPRLNLTAGSYKWAVRAGNTLGWSSDSTWLVFSVL